MGKLLEETKLRSKTRNGAQLEFSDPVALLIYLEREWRKVKELSGCPIAEIETETETETET